jgi:hypothetical protein
MTQVETPAANTGIMPLAVLCFDLTFVLRSSFVFSFNICVENRHLRQARNN